MVKQNVNDYPGDRYVEPYREHQPCEVAMFIRTHFQTQPKRANDKRRDQGCQKRMRGKDGEIDRPCDALAGEPRWSEPEIVCAQGVMRKIGDQKPSGHRASRQHAGPVAPDLICSNEIEPADHENAVRRIQDSVDVRKDPEKLHFPAISKRPASR